MRIGRTVIVEGDYWVLDELQEVLRQAEEFGDSAEIRFRTNGTELVADIIRGPEFYSR